MAVTNASRRPREPLNRRLVIAADLDGAFLAGTDVERDRFYSWLDQRDDVGLVFTTNRALANVAWLLGDTGIPTPQYIIGDSGCSVATSPGLHRIAELEVRMRRGWPGTDVVRAALEGVKGLSEQAVPQSGRVSYVLDRVGFVPPAAERVAVELGVRLSRWGGVYLDVLPPHASPGAALSALLDYAGASLDRALVCSHPLGDPSMCSIDARSVVVGAPRPTTERETRVYYARADGAGGIREAIAHYFGQHLL